MLEASENGTAQSRFTHRDLRLLSQSSTSSPLRVIALVDFDCFYAQCEIVRLGLPDDQPLGVQQFLHVIATNYPARAAGLKKVVTAVEARQKCPGIVLQHVPTWREGEPTWAYRDDILDHMDSDKSSLDYYRLESRKAIQVVKDTLPDEPVQRIEKAGIDEVFLDLSAQVHAVLLERFHGLTLRDGQLLDERLMPPPRDVLDWEEDFVVGTDESGEDLRIADWDDVALNVGAEIVRNLRGEIRKQLRYTCSAGIAHNKVVAKLAAGHKKPNNQTVVRRSCVGMFLSPYKITKLRGLGGKLGSATVKAFSMETIEDLLQVSLKEMQLKLGRDSGQWVYRVIRGVEYSEVVSRTIIKSMASAKTFNPKISGMEQAERWLRIFAADIMGRIEEQEGRRPRTIAVHHAINGRFGPTRGKQAPIPLGMKLDTSALFMLARNVLADVTRQGTAWPCLLLTISVSDFFDTETTSHSITSFWSRQPETKDASSEAPRSEERRREQAVIKNARKRTILDYQTLPSPKSNGLLGADCDAVTGALFKRRRENDPTGPESASLPDAADGTYSCPKCTKSIAATDVLEHLDWHVALDFQHQV